MADKLKLYFVGANDSINDILVWALNEEEARSLYWEWYIDLSIYMDRDFAITKIRRACKFDLANVINPERNLIN